MMQIQYDSFLGRVFADRYTLVSIIGVGECSAVFGAFDRETGQTVALKMLAPDRVDDADAVRRFLTEVRVLSLFDHPNIVKILDTSLDGEDKFFVMEYIEGITLKKHILNKGALSEEEILFLSRPILSALAQVHSKGIIHSDIKPQNIVLVGSGEIKLMDFGISKAQDSQNEEALEITMGTVQYVSPEQAEGKPLDHLSDIYSFGVMLYEMATGVLPFDDEDSGRIAAMHVSSQPIPPSMVHDKVSTDLDTIVLRAMEKSPEARFESAKDLLEALENMHVPKKSEPAHTETPKLQEFWKRLHLPSCLAGVLCALFLCVLVSLTALFSALSRQEKERTYIRTPDLVGEFYISPDAFGFDSELYLFRIEYVSSPKNGGMILGQSPAPDKLIKRGDKPLEITLTVALRPLPELMPNITHLTQEEALAYLARYDCEVKKVYAPHDYLPSGYVFATEPTCGEGTLREITLYISQK